MKQKVVKKVMALMLSAALVLPGVPMETYAAVTSAHTDSVSGKAQFVITNPGDSVNAYAGQPIVFYVRANEAESYAAAGLESFGTGDAAATFDAGTGKFKWTPGEESAGQSYKVTFTASRGTGDAAETVTKEVTIQVGSAGKEYKTAVLTVTDDARVETWGTENRAQNLGDRPLLSVRKGNAANQDIGTFNKGLMGEQSGTGSDATNGTNFDVKLSLLKFNLAEGYKNVDSGEAVTVDPSKIVSAELSLTYVTCRGTEGSIVHQDKDEQLNVAVVPSNDWTEENLTWNKWIEMTKGESTDESERLVYTADQIRTSAVYNTSNTGGGGATNTWDICGTTGNNFNANYALDGRKITVNITDFVKAEIEDSDTDKNLSLVINDTLGTEHCFVSKEGAGIDSNATVGEGFNAIKERQIKNAAPSIIVTYEEDIQQDAALEGADYMVLEEEYEATGSDSFIILGGTQNSRPSVTLSGNTAGGKITWNDQEQRFEIPAGLTTGAYEMQLEATGSDNKTATEDFTLYIKSNTSLPKFTYPRTEMKAFVGRSLAFYVKADNSEDFGDRVTLALEDGDYDSNRMTGVSFEPETGKFIWTPGEDNSGQSYDVTFTAYDHSKIPVKYTVTIDVEPSAEIEETDQVIAAVEDAHAQTWGGSNSEQKNNYGGSLFLRSCWVSGKGVLGEGTLPTDTNVDTKLMFLKFNLADFANKEFDGGNLVLTYIAQSDTSAQGDPKFVDTSVQIRAAALPYGFEWTQGTGGRNGVETEDTSLTWGTWKEWRDDTSDGKEQYAVKEEDAVTSQTYFIKEGTSYYANSLNNDFNYINGTKIKVDVSDFLEAALEDYKENPSHDTLTLLVNNSSSEKFFVSTEGAGANGFTNKTAMNGEEIMAPSIILTKARETAIADGPSSMVLTEGYSDAESNSFTVIGNPDEVTITARDSDNKITWDASTRQLKIAEGLKLGTYTVLLNVKNQVDRRFEVRVAANDKEAMQAVYDKRITDQGRYTSASWARYQYAVKAIEAALQTEAITGEDFINGRAMIQSARAALKSLENEIYDQIEKYKTIYESGDGIYKPENLSALNEKITAATAVMEKDNFTEEEMMAVVDAMASVKMEYASEKGALQAEINAAKEQYGEDKKAGYTEASWTALQDAIKEAETVFANANATDAQISNARTGMTDAANELETLDDALARLIGEAQNGILGEETDYTEDSWGVYMVALEAVSGLSGSVYTETRMNQLLALLDTAINNLKLREEQIPCTCTINFTGFEGFTMALGSTKTLAPRAVIDDTDCQAPEGKHITEENVAFAYKVADAATPAAPSAISVTEGGVVTALGNGTATILVTVTVTRPGSGSSSTTLSIPVTVNETGEAEKVTVTFNSNGGTNVAAQEIDQNTAVSEPAAPTKDGYTFTGWYKDEALKEKYDFSQPVTTDITLYAGWNKTTQNPGAGEDNDDHKVAVGADTTIGATVYTLGANNTVIIKKGADTATVSIPATVKVNNVDCKVVGIGNSAFAGYKKVKKVVIGSNVTSIGDQAFANCTSLTNVTIGAGVTTIGKKAFFKDKKLKTVKIAGTALKSIKGQAFKGTKSNIKVKLPKKMKAAQKNKIKRLLKKAKISSKAVIK